MPICQAQAWPRSMAWRSVSGIGSLAPNPLLWRDFIMRRFLKIGLVFVLCVVVAVTVLGVYFYQRQQRLLRESPFLHEMNSLVERNEFDAVTQRLIDKARTADKGESRLIVIWLRKHAVEGNFPTLYFTSLFYTTQGRLEDAGKWYSAAALVARVDAGRCRDASAGGAPRVIEGLFSNTKTHLAADIEERKAAAQWALEYEEKTRGRPVARWILQHGIKAFRGDAQSVPDAEWQIARSRIRADFEHSFVRN